MQSLTKQIANKRGGEMAQAILKATDEVRAWGELLKSKDENIKLKALIYLSNRAYGMPPQAIEATGSDGGAIRVVVEHIGTSNPAPAQAE